MEEKKNTQNDSKPNVSKTSKSKPMKQRSVKPKPTIPHTEEDFSFDTDDYTDYREDNRGD